MLEWVQQLCMTLPRHRGVQWGGGLRIFPKGRRPVFRSRRFGPIQRSEATPSGNSPASPILPGAAFARRTRSSEPIGWAWNTQGTLPERLPNWNTYRRRARTRIVTRQVAPRKFAALSLSRLRHRRWLPREHVLRSVSLAEALFLFVRDSLCPGWHRSEERAVATPAN